MLMYEDTSAYIWKNIYFNVLKWYTCIKTNNFMYMNRMYIK